MRLPEEFDSNEWFVIISLIIATLMILLLPKKLPLSISILMILFGSTVGRLTDRFLAAPNWDLYDIMDTGKYDLFDFLTYVLFGLFAYLFAYLFENMNIRRLNLLFFVLICAILGTIFEYVSLYFHVFEYKSWEINYSFNVYLVVQALTLFFYSHIKNVHKKHTLKASSNE